MTESQQNKSRACRVIVKKLGWAEDEDGSYFRAECVFPDGPPSWPIRLVWDRTPMLLSLDAPEGR